MPLDQPAAAWDPLLPEIKGLLVVRRGSSRAPRSLAPPPAGLSVGAKPGPGQPASWPPTAPAPTRAGGFTPAQLNTSGRTQQIGEGPAATKGALVGANAPLGGARVLGRRCACPAPMWTGSRQSVCTRSCGSRRAARSSRGPAEEAKSNGAVTDRRERAPGRIRVGLVGGPSTPETGNAGRFRAKRKACTAGRSPSHSGPCQTSTIRSVQPGGSQIFYCCLARSNTSSAGGPSHRSPRTAASMRGGGGEALVMPRRSQLR